MGWLTAAVEQAMKRQEVILSALSGALTSVQAADILGIDPRSLRRWRARYEGDQLSVSRRRRPRQGTAWQHRHASPSPRDPTPWRPPLTGSLLGLTAIGRVVCAR